MEAYEYEALPGENYIRIIKLLPGASEDVIQCNLTAELRHPDQKPYNAISYVWGEKSALVEIICCGKSMHITTNLHDALRAIRAKNPGVSVRLWADAMSIKQTDTEEKNHQIKGMGIVYQNAAQVHIWLGLDEDSIAQETFKLIQGLNEILFHHKSPPNYLSWILLRHLTYDYQHRGLKLAAVMRLPWFSRVWVIQEVALSRRAQLHWGSASMDFADLIELAYKNGLSKHDAKSGLFLDIILIGKSLKASEVQDHIYAFLGNPLALDDKGHLLIEPDYKKTIEEVNIELADALLSCSREAPYVLSFVQHNSATDVNDNSFPSWVPRWGNVDTNGRSIFTIGNIGLEQCAGGGVEKLQYAIYDTKALGAKGMLIEELCWASETLASDDFALDSTRWKASLQASDRLYVEILWDEVSLAFSQYMGPDRMLDRARYSEDFTFTLVTGYRTKEVISQKRHEGIIKAYCEVLQGKRKGPSGEHLVSKRQNERANRCERQFHNCSNRRFGITKSGGFALVPRFAQAGDVCAILCGMATPFILRRADPQIHGEGHYHLVGEAYIHGAMRGELAEKLDKDKVDLKLI
ncbi:hypothetical protein EK21DRAFT_68950 [Setomelanomma holmii]|uniref:Heterokaryon incompatibility domain-containing protein n=1 Tax=Setomelanomma holmii TaxID=210430 RepID=A0A9P4H714_9PLEO|nr:hypothetical protein EK21DRAFT_68950 [Setomelanomma holmii]